MEYSISTRELAEQPVIVGRRRAPRAGIAASIGDVLPRIFQHAQEQGIELSGPPFVRYVDPNPEMMTFEPGMPVAADVDAEGGAAARDAAGLTLDVLPGGTVVTAVHVGPYETLHEAYAAIERWIADEGMTRAGAPWESYLTDPTTVPDPAEWQTEVCWPVEAGS